MRQAMGHRAQGEEGRRGMSTLRYDDSGSIDEVMAEGCSEADGAETRISIGSAVGFGLDEVVAIEVETTGAKAA